LPLLTYLQRDPGLREGHHARVDGPGLKACWAATHEANDQQEGRNREKHHFHKFRQ
jgi:hypothetical protein